MTGTFRDRVNAPEMRYAYQLTYSMHMIGEIASRYRAAQDSDDLLPAMAMLDAFYVHLRLVAEFLTRPTTGRDFGPKELGIDGWVPPDTQAATRLGLYWDRASKYVVHFGHPRVPENLEELRTFEVGATALKAMARDAFEVLGILVAQLEARVNPEPGLTVERHRVQFLRDELNRSSELVGDD